MFWMGMPLPFTSLAAKRWRESEIGHEHIVLWSRAFSSFQHVSSHNAGPPHIFRHRMDRIDKDPISSFQMVLVIFHTCFTSRTQVPCWGSVSFLRPLRSRTSHCKIFHQQRTCAVAAGCSRYLERIFVVERIKISAPREVIRFFLNDGTIIMIMLNCEICWYNIYIDMYVCWYSNSCNHPWSNFNLQDLTSISFRRPGQHYFASLEMSSLWDCELERGIRLVLPEVSQRNNTGTA